MRTAILLAFVVLAMIAILSIFAMLASSLPEVAVDCTREPGLPGGDLDCPPGVSTNP